ncbi:MAG: hypothetical protein KF851_14185 [Pirellulaceae bacterium]|nr:hypothetical protein [Pirellulaceae bacterium]
MKSLRTGLLIGFVLLAVLGCDAGKDLEPEHHKVAKTMIARLQGLTELLKGITDVATAEAALPEIESIMKEFEIDQKNSQSIPDPTPEQEKELEELFKDQMIESQIAFQQEMFRLSMNREAIEIIKPALTRLSQAKDK